MEKNMEIVLASRNKNKIKELETLLSELCGDKVKVLSLDDIGYEGDIEEDGESYEENAVIKASVPASLGYIGVSDDSGLSVDCLDGAPGIYSARYAGEDVTYAENNALLLKNMDKVKDSDRGAAFVSVVALVAPEGLLNIPHKCTDGHLTEFACGRSGRKVDVLAVRGECRGVILNELRGEGGFGYDPLFYVPEEGETFAQLSPEAKNKISHRGKAMRAFAAEINKLVKEL